MKREDYLRELEIARVDLRRRAHDLASAANPVSQFRRGIARDWKWWLPGASAAGFLGARLLRGASARPRGTKHGDSAGGGGAFWVLALLKVLPSVLAQVVPLILSLRSGRRHQD
jgi:hypothetical protein